MRLLSPCTLRGVDRESWADTYTEIGRPELRFNLGTGECSDQHLSAKSGVAAGAAVNCANTTVAPAAGGFVRGQGKQFLGVPPAGTA